MNDFQLLSFPKAKANLAEALRHVADQMDLGNHGNVEAVVVVLQGDNGLDVFAAGDADEYRATGLLTAAAMVLNLGDEE